VQHEVEVAVVIDVFERSGPSLLVLRRQPPDCAVPDFELIAS